MSYFVQIVQTAIFVFVLIFITILLYIIPPSPCWFSHYYYYSFFLSSIKSLSNTFLGDALIKLYETLQEYHMPCEVVLVRVDFFKMAAVIMETIKMLQKKHKNDHSRLLAKQKLMKLDRNNIHI